MTTLDVLRALWVVAAVLGLLFVVAVVAVNLARDGHPIAALVAVGALIFALLGAGLQEADKRQNRSTPCAVERAP